MATKKRVYPKSVKIYFQQEDEGLYNFMKSIAEKSRLSISMVGFLMLEHGVPQAEEALRIFQSSYRKDERKKKSRT